MYNIDVHNIVNKKNSFLKKYLKDKALAYESPMCLRKGKKVFRTSKLRNTKEFDVNPIDNNLVDSGEQNFSGIDSFDEEHVNEVNEEGSDLSD